MTITLTDYEIEVLNLVIEDAIDQLDMDNLNEVHALNTITDKLNKKEG